MVLEAFPGDPKRSPGSEAFPGNPETFLRDAALPIFQERYLF